MKPKAFLLAAFVAAVSTQGISMAAEVSTEPVGVVKISLQPRSDKRVSIPLHRTPAFVGQVAAISNNELTISGANFTADQFVKSSGVQPNSYYVRVSTGTAAGTWYNVIGNSTDKITVESNLETSLQTQGLAPGTGIGKILVVPHWTPRSLFPQLNGIVASSDPFAPTGTMLLMMDPAAQGKNIGPSFVYFYHDGSSGFLTAGWYSTANVFAGQVSDVPIAPDEQFVIRNRSTSVMSTSITGIVPATNIATTLVRRATVQDNLMTQPYPVPVSPSKLGLVQSGAFRPSTQVFAPEGDFLMGFDPNYVGFNIAPTRVYIYHDGSSGFLSAGWYNTANVFAGSISDQDLFGVGEAFVVRKASGIPLVTPWKMDIPYGL